MSLLAPSLPSHEPQKCLCKASGLCRHMVAPQTWWTWISHWRIPWQTFRWLAPLTCKDPRCCREEGKRTGFVCKWIHSYEKDFLSGCSLNDLLPTRVRPKTPDWRGWLYRWTPLTRCFDICARRTWQLGSTLPPPTTDLPPLTSHWPAEAGLTWAWRKPAPEGLDGLSSLRDDMGLKQSACFIHQQQGMRLTCFDQVKNTKSN